MKISKLTPYKVSNSNRPFTMFVQIYTNFNEMISFKLFNKNTKMVACNWLRYYFFAKNSLYSNIFIVAVLNYSHTMTNLVRFYL